MHLSENQDLIPVTQNESTLTFDAITKVAGLKLMHMHELHGYTM